MIDAQKITHRYGSGSRKSLDSVSFTVKRGEWLAILGHNGSGKSTLARHLNALLELQSGALTVAGIDAADSAAVWQLRRRVGMVFQNPDNQFVSSVVEEDVAFGLENYGVARKEIPVKVEDALAQVGMSGFEKRSPHALSGGQKQRVAIAGVLALEPEILVFDEATAMLDPAGRQEVLEIMRQLHRKGTTILMITHYVEEAVEADRVLVLKQGKVLTEGTPRAILSDAAILQDAGLLPPMCVRLYYDLRRQGVDLPQCPLNNEEMAEMLCP